MHSETLIAILSLTLHGSHSTLPPANNHTFVIPPRVAQLVEVSEVVVLARVESVNGGPEVENRQARARVLEVWKGSATASVEYRVSPTFACDIPDAKKGETVLLFLEKEETGLGIAWAGRGRMPFLKIDGVEYLSHFADVIFPAGTPQVRIPEKDEDGFDRAVELKMVKELVRKATAQKREEGPAGRQYDCVHGDREG